MNMPVRAATPKINPAHNGGTLTGALRKGKALKEGQYRGKSFRFGGIDPVST